MGNAAGNGNVGNGNNVCIFYSISTLGLLLTFERMAMAQDQTMVITMNLGMETLLAVTIRGKKSYSVEAL